MDDKRLEEIWKGFTHTPLGLGEMEALRWIRDEASRRETVWLIEWPADDNLPVRWWHPQGGWMMDAAKALRFARKEDGEAYAASSLGLTGRPVTEHIFISR